MKKQKALSIVNVMLFLFFLWVIITAFLHELMSPALYEKLHPIGGFLFFLTALIHIYLNWSWIKSNVLKK
ncbi:DUF4405 domain-containing protein [candidate division KSB1 bacterium]|nr:DUF4405 domain-containing protein [candidate division KSB1 bacterium]